MRRAGLKMLFMIGLATLAGCGFQLRGQALLPFNAAFVEAGRASNLSSNKANDKPTSSKSDSVLAGLLRDALGQQSKLAGLRAQADVIIRLTGETREKTILSLSGAGKVREFRLIHSVSVSAINPDGKEILAPVEIKLSRDMSYSDAQVLAKEAEEAMLRRDMDEDALRQILRRLAFVHK